MPENGDNLGIKIKYHEGITPLKKIEVGDWIDLRSAETVEFKAGDSCYINLGVSMKLPEGYEAIVAPRSSLFKKKGLIQANSISIIDNSYCGDEDIWRFPVYATRDCVVNFDERICQFRLLKNQPTLQITKVEKLGGENRGGYGSTGGYVNES
ncbi:MAG: deoxyuridine 5'-triphosphate nucleotidohydrolase [Eubacterium sp.]|nr:deoxyuridine 5'-triphosphate nucleotidohydrolase [Eubacterium sp.]